MELTASRRIGLQLPNWLRLGVGSALGQRDPLAQGDQPLSRRFVADKRRLLSASGRADVNVGTLSIISRERHAKKGFRCPPVSRFARCLDPGQGARIWRT